ncbi:STAS domain-containing protein [Chloroflexota bacterium]
MEIKGTNYHVTYDSTTATVALQGTLRLRGINEYDPIVELLDDVTAQEPETITLNLQNLQFLNSSGINILFKFVIQIREQGSSKLVVRGSTKIPWQKKSLQNLQRLMAGVQLEWGE